MKHGKDNHDDDGDRTLGGIIAGLDSIGTGRRAHGTSSDGDNSGSASTNGNETGGEDSLGNGARESGTNGASSAEQFSFGEPGSDDGDNGGGRTGRRSRRRSTSNSSGNGRTSSGKSKRAAAKASLVVENEEDIKNFIVGGYASAATYTGFDGFKVTDDEALTIARPAARLLARNPILSEAVFKFSDPITLIVAVVSLTAPRILAYKWIMANQVQAVEQSQSQETVQTQPSQPTKPSGNGTGNGKDMNLVQRISFI